MATKKTLAIDLLRTDGETQCRVEVCGETVDNYAELLETRPRWPFPELDIFYDGSDYWVADGFHRLLASHRVGRSSVPCLLHRGTAADARIFGMTANDQHGLRMSRADKRACVEWLFATYPRMSQRDAADKAGVGVRTVQRIAADLREAASNGQLDTPTKKKKKKKKTTPAKSQASPAAEYYADVDSSEAADAAPSPDNARKLAHAYRDKLVRAIGDYDNLRPNPRQCDKLIKLVQGIVLWK